MIGKPSDWLIASQVDYENLNKRFGINAIEINIEELIYVLDTHFESGIGVAIHGKIPEG